MLYFLFSGRHRIRVLIFSHKFSYPVYTMSGRYLYELEVKIMTYATGADWSMYTYKLLKNICIH